MNPLWMHSHEGLKLKRSDLVVYIIHFSVIIAKSLGIIIFLQNTVTVVLFLDKFLNHVTLLFVFLKGMKMIETYLNKK